MKSSALAQAISSNIGALAVGALAENEWANGFGLSMPKELTAAWSAARTLAPRGTSRRLTSAQREVQCSGIPKVRVVFHRVWTTSGPIVWPGHSDITGSVDYSIEVDGVPKGPGSVSFKQVVEGPVTQAELDRPPVVAPGGPPFKQFAKMLEAPSPGFGVPASDFSIAIERYFWDKCQIDVEILKMVGSMGVPKMLMGDEEVIFNVEPE